MIENLKRYTMAVDDQKGLYHYWTAKGKWLKFSDVKKAERTAVQAPCIALLKSVLNIIAWNQLELPDKIKEEVDEFLKGK